MMSSIMRSGCCSDNPSPTRPCGGDAVEYASVLRAEVIICRPADRRRAFVEIGFTAPIVNAVF